MMGIFPVPLSVVRRKSKKAGSYLFGPYMQPKQDVLRRVSPLLDYSERVGFF
jgi:hypothetical protein